MKMTVYLNKLPATLDNAKRIMEEQDAMIKEFRFVNTLLRRVYDHKYEDFAFKYISLIKASDDSPSITFFPNEYVTTAEWIQNPGFESIDKVAEFLAVYDTVVLMDCEMFKHESDEEIIEAEKENERMNEEGYDFSDDIPF